MNVMKEDVDYEEMERGIQAYTVQMPVTINSQPEAAAATSNLAELMAKKKWVGEVMDPGIEKAKNLLAELKGKKDLVLAPILEREGVLKKNLITWKILEDSKARQAQDKRNAAYDKQVEKAIEKGKPIENIKPAMLVPIAAKTTQTEAGAVTFRNVVKLQITDEALIPDEYMKITKTPAKAAIKTALENGKLVPGCSLLRTKEIAGKF